MSDPKTRAILARLDALEARLSALEQADCCGGGACCESSERLDPQFRGRPVGEPRRHALRDDLRLCAQLYEIPALVERGEPHVLVSTWLEDANGERIGRLTCTCKSGNCNISKTCDNGNPFCDCVKCTMTCD